MTEFADVAVVTLRCDTDGCHRWATAYGKHLDNLLAAGPWRCPDHNVQEATR
ncbi:hypothetical protein KUV85_06815 [Nocardioides panacisoli]|uniref:hypothetical protein n=1 Tax=Nocardioides panacisoli TaxID=627624 RepID=UPI001C625B30|nr:hypothetical protein [Nocardioides panacisoli]QYJ05385.1 hypothetical protein KUV85_06815 [Nocardioides panacisoli]